MVQRAMEQARRPVRSSSTFMRHHDRQDAFAGVARTKARLELHGTRRVVVVSNDNSTVTHLVLVGQHGLHTWSSKGCPKVVRLRPASGRRAAR